MEIALTLQLTSAPQLAGLARWLQRESEAVSMLPAPAPRPPASSSGLGCWGVVGALTVGWWIGGL